MTSNEKLLFSFKAALGRLNLADLDPELVAGLHKRLVTKVFHAQTKDEVKEYQEIKLDLLKSNERSKLAFRGGLLAASDNKRAQKEKKDKKRPSSTPNTNMQTTQKKQRNTL